MRNKPQIDTGIIYDRRHVNFYQISDDLSEVDIINQYVNNVNEIKLNGLCKIDAINADKKETEAFYAAYSYTAPPVIFKYDASSNTTTTCSLSI